jgi:hypothetical protein
MTNVGRKGKPMLFVSAVDLLVFLKGGSVSEPFLLAGFGVLLLLAGNVIRQHEARRRRYETNESTKKQSSANLKDYDSASQSTVKSSIWNPPSRGEVLGTPESGQLWLPMRSKHDVNEGGAEVMRH